MKNVQFTKQGFNDISDKLDLEIKKRPEAVKTLTRAREMGDLSENGLYKAARFELSNIDRQIRFFKNLIKYGFFNEIKDNNTVQIGHTVVIENNEGKKTYQIVGEYEADPKNHKISNKSPIGYSLMGKIVGSEVKINTPNGNINYKIKSIK